MGIEILIIHLARAEARRPHVEHLLASLPLPGSIIDAVDGRELTDADVNAVYRPNQHRPRYPFALSRNEIACFLSHRRAWQAIVDRKLQAALIMEDDAAPAEGFLAGLQLAADHVQQRGFIRFPFRDNRETGHRIASAGGFHLMAPRVVGLGMVTQLISRNAAVQLLRATEVFDRPVDTLMQMPWVTGISPVSVAPAVVSEISSSLGGTTLQKRAHPLAKMHREIWRPIYRMQIRLRSSIAGVGRPGLPAERKSSAPVSEPPAIS